MKETYWIYIGGHIYKAKTTSAVVAPVPYTRMPNSSLNFTGLTAYLEMLQKHFIDHNESSKTRECFLLFGLGGSGKTQICLKFAEENADRSAYS